MYPTERNQSLSLPCHVTAPEGPFQQDLLNGVGIGFLRLDHSYPPKFCPSHSSPFLSACIQLFQLCLQEWLVRSGAAKYSTVGKAFTMPSILSVESAKTYGLLSESIPVYSSFGFIANRQQRSKRRTGPHQVRTFTAAQQ